MFSTLLRNGRLQLSLLLHHTGLSSRQLKHSLAVLIQQHLVYHYKTTDGDATFYEADWKSAYALVRPGKIIKLVEERFGKVAGGVISNLLLLGHARVDDLVAAYNLDAGRDGRMDAGNAAYIKGGGMLNGAGKVKTANTTKARGLTLEVLHTTIYNLLEAGFLMQVLPAHFRSLTDNRNEAERVVQRYAEFGGPPKGTKQKAAFEAEVQKQLQTWQLGDKFGAKFVDGAAGARKRPMGCSAQLGPGKRARLEDGSAYHQDRFDDDDGPILDVRYD